MAMNPLDDMTWEQRFHAALSQIYKLDAELEKLRRANEVSALERIRRKFQSKEYAIGREPKSKMPYKQPLL